MRQQSTEQGIDECKMQQPTYESNEEFVSSEDKTMCRELDGGL